MKVEVTREPAGFRPLKISVELESSEELESMLAFTGGLCLRDVERTIRGSRRSSASATPAAILMGRTYDKLVEYTR